jgi:hypothetical protein
MLRITYEVVKSIDTSALVAVGNIRRVNFLDAILRNTDNPNAGKITASYPYKCGAYFDMLTFNSPLQYTLKEWDDTKKIFNYHRHSDAAVKKIQDMKTSFEKKIASYGYNDTLYPRKHFVLAKANVPRKQYTDRDFIGSVEAQRNFLMKMFVKGQAIGLTIFLLI